MQKPGDLLENLLNEIEKRIKEDINTNLLADKFCISSVHLQRLFRFAFKQSLGAYIRSRKLTASLDSLLNTNLKLINIALDYGFEYEQSYIRTFKREFGITPGDLRKTGQIIKIKPPLRLLDENKLENSVFFGPDIVMVPRFHIAGRKHQVPHDITINRIFELANQFWENERKQIQKIVNPNMFICLTRNINWEEKHSEYITAVQVEDLKNMPQDLYSNTFETSMCAGFRYIGQQPCFIGQQLYPSDSSNNLADIMYNSVNKYIESKKAEYVLFKIDTRFYGDTYYQIELYTPVSKLR